MTTPQMPIAMPEPVLAHHALYRVERYSVQQAAVYLCTSRARIYQLATEGRIAHGKRSQKIFFAQADLDAYRESQRVEARVIESPRGSRVVKMRRAPVPAATLPPIKHPRFA